MDDRIRQVSLNSLNESVSLISNYPGENMEYLTNLGLSLLKKIKENGKR